MTSVPFLPATSAIVMSRPSIFLRWTSRMGAAWPICKPSDAEAAAMTANPDIASRAKVKSLLGLMVTDPPSLMVGKNLIHGAGEASLVGPTFPEVGELSLAVIEKRRRQRPRPLCSQGIDESHVFASL